mmetsp:Transcript_7122/g.24500  ORF Transcript_7122/g.24500 Transcript_7122/m.24500 type:complete len:236 (-) Transcript_7122:896-1603(-)
MGVHGQQKVVGSKLWLVVARLALLGQVLVQDEERGQALVHLLHIQVGVEPVRVGDGRGLLAELVLCDDVEPDHLLQAPHREGVLDVLDRHVRPNRTVPVPQEPVHLLKCRALAVHQREEVRHGAAQGPSCAKPIRLSVLLRDRPGEPLHGELLHPEAGVVIVGLLQLVKIICPEPPVKLGIRAHGLARSHDRGVGTIGCRRGGSGRGGCGRRPRGLRLWGRQRWLWRRPEGLGGC